MPGDSDSADHPGDDFDGEATPHEESAEELFLSEPEEEVVAPTPEVELLNDVTQHYLNEIGAKPLFTPEEGRLGIVVTFLGMLTLAKEQLIEIVQEAALQPIYIKSLATTDAPAEVPDSEFDSTAED